MISKRNNVSKISIIIPTSLKRKNQLLNLITSLNKQILDRKLYEIIIIINNAKNIDFGFLRNLKIDQTIIDNDISGPGPARNLGSRNAHGDILVFTDDDCIPQSDWLFVVWHAFINENIDYLSGEILPQRKNKYTLLEMYIILSGFLRDPIKVNGNVVCIPTANLAIRTEVFNQIGGFDERINTVGGEDTDLTYRLMKSGFIYQHNPKFKTYHNHNIDLLHHCKRWYYYGMGVKMHIVIRRESNIYGLIISESLFGLLKNFGEIVTYSKVQFGKEYSKTLPLSVRLIFHFYAFVREFFYQLGAINYKKRSNL